MKYSKDFENLNEILADWNPIGLPNEVSKSEYLSYVQNLYNYKDDFLGLVKHLEFLMTQKMELYYDSDDILQKKEILFYAYKIYKLLES